MFADSRAFSGFAVRDLTEARAFYEGTLGLVVDELPMGVLELRLGSGTRVMIYPRPDFRPATYTILNFPVPDVGAAVDALEAAGIRMERYEGFDQDARGISRAADGPTIAWFTDPSGNILAVLDEGIM